MKRSQLFLFKPRAFIFGLAVLVRLLYNYLAARDYYPLHDSATYQSIAYNLLREQCYCLVPHLPTVDRAPLWPAIVALIYGMFGAQDRIVRTFLCFVGAATCILIYTFARDLFGKKIALCAGLLATVYPFLYIYDGWLYSESLYTFLLLAFCYTLYRFQHAPDWKKSLLSGILLGLLSLTRPNGLIIFGLFLLWLCALAWGRTLRWREAFQGALIVSLVLFAIIAPWTVRNYLATGTVVPIAIGDGKVLIGAYNDFTDDPSFQNGYYLGTWLIPNESNPTLVQQFPQDCAGSCEVKRDAAYKLAALQWIQQHPDKALYLAALHFANTWQITTQEADLPIIRFPDRPTSIAVVTSMVIMTPLLFALAAFGLIVTRRYWRELLFTYLIIVLTVGQNIILYGIPRFRAPIEPLLILLAAGAIWWLTSAFNKKQQKKLEETKEASPPSPPPARKKAIAT